jgi:hypothetical protein
MVDLELNRLYQLKVIHCQRNSKVHCRLESCDLVVAGERDMARTGRISLRAGDQHKSCRCSISNCSHMLCSLATINRPNSSRNIVVNYKLGPVLKATGAGHASDPCCRHGQKLVVKLRITLYIILYMYCIPVRPKIQSALTMIKIRSTRSLQNSRLMDYNRKNALQLTHVLSRVLRLKRSKRVQTEASHCTALLLRQTPFRKPAM